MFTASQVGTQIGTQVGFVLLKGPFPPVGQGAKMEHLQSAAYAARLGALRAALHMAAREAATHNHAGRATEGLAVVIDALAATWEEAKAAEEAAAAEKAAEYKMKEQSLHVLNEEVAVLLGVRPRHGQGFKSPKSVIK